jgi:uncharacterized protein YbaP (TraB family)
MRILPKTGILTRMSRARAPLLRVAGPARRRRASRTLALAAAAAVLASCVTPHAAPRAPRETGQLVFWEVRAGEGPGRAWLLGSVHSASPDLVFDPAVERAFEASDALVLETDISSIAGPDSFAFLERTLRTATLPEGQTLDQLLTAPAWEQLGDFLRARGQPADAYRRYKPWLVMTVVSSFLFAEAGLPAEGGVDYRFSRLAEGKLPIVALETPEFQLSLYDSLPLDVQASLLTAMLAHQGEVRSTSLRIYDAWRLGDLDVIEEETLGSDSDPELRGFQERVYGERNRAMAERIGELLREDRTWFVVLGAGHMVGKEGIPSLLAQQGQQVTRIPKSAAPAG